MKTIKRVMLFLLLILTIVAISVFIFLQVAPQIGGTPSGARLAQMQKAANFKDGIFTNTVETSMNMSPGTLKKVLAHYLFADKSGKSPKETLTTQPFRSDEFEKLSDRVVAVSWFGHSSILLKIEGVGILIDPVLEGTRASMFSFMGPKRFPYSENPTVGDLPAIDLVIISHDHYDHLDYPTIRLLKDRVKQFYVPLGVGAHLERWGIAKDRIKELEWWDEVQYRGLELVFTPARHFSGRGLSDRFKTLWGSWVIMGKEKRLYFSGDSGYFPGFKEIGDRYGPFDLTMIECGAYNEGWSEIHMFPEQTVQAHLDLRGKLLMPIHWGKFDLSLHPWKESVNRLEAKAAGIQLFTPEVGRLTTLADSASTHHWWNQVD